MEFLFFSPLVFYISILRYWIINTSNLFWLFRSEKILNREIYVGFVAFYVGAVYFIAQLW